MKLRVMITETREIEVDDKFIDLFKDDENKEAIAMITEKVGLETGSKDVVNKPYIYCVETEEGYTLYEWD